MMKYILSVTVFYSFCTLASAQAVSKKMDWYSEANTNGIVTQNSLPRGGPYRAPTKNNFNCSRLVFFTRVVNETQNAWELKVNFTPDSISIPGSPDTFMKLFLPSDTMTYDKRSVFNYGVKELESFDKPTRFQRTIRSNEECLFYVVAIFYQTKATAQNQDRGGNRAEFVLKGQDLYYRMPPQVEYLPCGQIVFKR